MSQSFLKDFLLKYKSPILGVLGIASLISYFFARKSIKNQHNKLQITLEDLLNEKRQSMIKKIVITESSESTLQIRHHIVEQLKKILTEMKIKVLVNCSPQKLLKAGCSSFRDNVNQTSKKFIDYYLYSLRTQLIIEKTILDIDLATRQINKDELIVMICDNNSMDIKVGADQWRWCEFIAKYNINESNLMLNYDLALHIYSDKLNDEDLKIAQVWKNHPKYQALNVEGLKSQEQNVKEGLEFIKKFISEQKSKIVRNELVENNNA